MAYWPDTGTGVDTQPARKPVQSAIRKYFTEGGVGQAPTVPGGDWFNQMTNEVLNVLEAAGVEPSKTDDDQLLQAIKITSEAMTSRESLRRTYAEARYNLRPEPESFSNGGTLTSAVDVLLDRTTGKAYSGSGPFPQVVAEGTDPSSGGFSDRSDERLLEILSRITGTSMIGSENGPLNEVLYALKRVSPIETRFAGGADPTGVADSTDALEACIEYCAPFVWKGSVATTKAAMGEVVAAMTAFGTFRITRPLKINPFLVMVSDHNGAFFGDKGGFRIIADFDDKDGFALDTAPYNGSGVRILGRKASRVDWDSGIYTGCPGWMLLGVEVSVATGRNLRGTLNRCMAIQSVVNRCSLEKANIGIQSSVCWGGSVVLNQITARAHPLLNSNDVTVDEQQANYLSVLGVKPVSGTEFTYPTWPDVALQGKTSPAFFEFSRPNFFHNILEGGQVAAMACNESNIDFASNYVEGSSFEYVFAGHTVPLNIKLHNVIAANAGLLWLRTAPVTLDASSAAYLAVAGWGSIDAASPVKVTGCRNVVVRRIPWRTNVEYTDIDVGGVVDIYLSGPGASVIGVDTDSGYSPSKPVLTLQEAMDRCIPGKHNRINVSGVATTKYNYSSGGTATDKVMSIPVLEINGGGSGSINVGQSSNQIHGLPAGVANVKLTAVALAIALANDNYKPFVACHGIVDIEVDSSTITGPGTLMGVKFGHAGMGNLTARNSTIACLLQHNGGAADAFSWIDTAINTSVVGGSVGASGSKKISSVLYP